MNKLYIFSCELYITLSHDNNAELIVSVASDLFYYAGEKSVETGNWNVESLQTIVGVRTRYIYVRYWKIYLASPDVLTAQRAAVFTLQFHCCLCRRESSCG